MEIRCQKCGSAATSDQPFCGRCGAVIGMVDASPGQDAPESLAATMVGKKLPTTPPPPRPAPRPPAPPSRPAVPAPAPAPAASAAGGAPRSNTLLYVFVGLVALLLVGGLLVLLFLLSLY